MCFHIKLQIQYLVVPRSGSRAYYSETSNYLNSYLLLDERMKREE